MRRACVLLVYLNRRNRKKEKIMIETHNLLNKDKNKPIFFLVLDSSHFFHFIIHLDDRSLKSKNYNRKAKVY